LWWPVASFTRKEVEMRVLLNLVFPSPVRTEFLTALGGKLLADGLEAIKAEKGLEALIHCGNEDQQVWEFSSLEALAEVELKFDSALVSSIKPWPIEDTKDGISVLSRGEERWYRDPYTGELCLLYRGKISGKELCKLLASPPLTSAEKVEEEERRRREAEEAERRRKEEERERKTRNLLEWTEVLEAYLGDLKEEVRRVETTLQAYYQALEAEDPLRAYEEVKEAYYAERMQWPEYDC